MFRLLIIVGFLSIPGIYHHYGAPFRSAKISIDWPNEPAWETGPAPAEISSILSEPFTFFGKGVQSFAFASRDGKYVLKFFRFDSCKMPQIKIFIHWMKAKFNKKQRKENRPEQIFQACKLSFDELREETGLVWAHLNLKPGTKIKVYDLFGLSHLVDPEKTRFVLQKRAVKLRDGPTEKFESFVSLLKSLEEKGIATTDSKLGSNFGFIEGRAVQIDFADNVYDPLLAHKNTAHFTELLRDKLK